MVLGVCEKCKEYRKLTGTRLEGDKPLTYLCDNCRHELFRKLFK